MRRDPLLLLLLSSAACTGARTEAAPAPTAAAARSPTIEVAPVAADAVCFTRGQLGEASRIADATMRGYVPESRGDAAQLTFTYRGESGDTRALASGDVRRQLGLKLRAQDSCNVVYVMWRLDPRPKLDVSIKSNPGKAAHEQCGADGYTKVRSRSSSSAPPAYEFGATHTLRAEIVGDDIYAWVDGRLAFEGRLPEAARTIRGPAGVRSDNVAFDLVELAVPRATDRGAAAACRADAASD